jgi:hypothetical protein
MKAPKQLWLGTLRRAWRIAVARRDWSRVVPSLSEPVLLASPAPYRRRELDPTSSSGEIAPATGSDASNGGAEVLVAWIVEFALHRGGTS